MIVDTIMINVNGIDLKVKSGTTILEAIRQADFKYLDMTIPTLYYLKGVKETDESGVCVVEVVGEDEVVQAWERQVVDGMKILTESEKVVAARVAALEKIMEKHDKDCINCTRSTTCDLQNVLHKYNMKGNKMAAEKKAPIDKSSIIVRDSNKCIRCGRCVLVCKDGQGVGAIEMTGEGLDAVVAPVAAEGLCATNCVNCGQCVAVCPVGALYEQDATDAVFAAINDPEKFVVVEVAPAVRATLGESFEFFIGSDVEKRMPAVLRELGFDKVFDTKFGADLTIMEEANEFLDRAANGGKLPLITSCCPGWVKYAEHNYPELLDNVSSCKSPQQMFGATVKSYYAEKMGIAKENIVVVSVMPCTAKKFEIGREDECGAGVPDIDISITTKELARMITKAEIQITAVPFDEFDCPLGIGSGAGVIFGTTGGVMEAALRTAVEKLSGEELPKLDFEEVRGMADIKEASYTVAGKTINVAIVSGLANAKELLDKVVAGTVSYDFIEIMACPGGCINGGGQPNHLEDVWYKEDVKAKRAAALYKNDAGSTVRKSHENPAIVELYDTYLGAPGSEKAHQLLHTTYIAR